MPSTRRRFASLTLGAAAASILPRNSVAEPAPAVFPYGTHVYREPSLPLEQLRADFPVLKKLGFTMIKIQESWSYDERREGEIDLARVASVVSAARQNGLLVYFGVTMEQAPAWLWKKFPDADMVYESGERNADPTQYLLPSDGKPGPCWHHPSARSAAVRFIETVGREIGRYDNIRVWNVWQEVGFELRPGHLGVCYCANSLREFRSWLRTKYPSLPALNAQWRTGYGDWDEVEPPRRFTQVPSWIDWRYFMEDVYLPAALLWKADAFRRSDPLHRPVMAHAGSPTYGSSADWRHAEPLDIYGSSAYPSWGELGDPDRTPAETASSHAAYKELIEYDLMKFDYVRAASHGKDFWTAELQGGRAGAGSEPGRVPEPSDIRRWTLSALAAGVRGICFWNHRSEPFWSEGYGFGLLELEGNTTPRAVEAGRIGRALQHHAELFTQGKVPRAACAILINEELWQFAGGTGKDFQNSLASSVRGLYKGMWEAGIPVDFLESGRIAAEGSAYRALLAPHPAALSPALIAALRDYVRSGGTLLAEACAGRYDHYGFGVAGEMAPVLAELFGARHQQIYVLKGEQRRRLDGAGDFSGMQLAPSHYLQTLAPAVGRPVLTYKDFVTGVANDFGQGRAYLAGTLIGPPLLAEKYEPGNRDFLAAVLAKAGVKPDRVGPFQRRRIVLGGQSAWFLFNSTPATARHAVAVGTARKVSDLMEGPLLVRDGRVEIEVEPMNLRCLIVQE